MGINRAEIAKYGGTSVYTQETIGQSVAGTKLHVNENTALVVVTSASYQTTEQLHDAIDLAINGGDYKAIVSEIGKKHEDLIGGIGRNEAAEPYENLDREIDELSNLLASVSLIGEAGASIQDRIVSSGERINTPIVCGYAKASGMKATYVPANEIVVTDDNFGAANPDIKKTRQNIKERALPLFDTGTVLYIGGYEGAFALGSRRISTTLGRGGSDETATLLAEALDELISVNGVYLYKAGVGGILAVDPNIIPNAPLNQHMTYREVAAFSGIGAKVLHPKAVRHVEGIGVPLYLRSTQNPSEPGTVVDGTYNEEDPVVKAVLYRANLPHLVVRGSGMDQPNIAGSVTTALGNSGWDINFISQSSEQSMVFALEPRKNVRSVESDVQGALAKQMKDGDVDSVEVGTIGKLGVVGFRVGRPEVKEKIYRGLRGTREYPVDPTPGDSSTGEYVESILLNEGDGSNLPNAVRTIFDEVTS